MMETLEYMFFNASGNIGIVDVIFMSLAVFVAFPMMIIGCPFFVIGMMRDNGDAPSGCPVGIQIIIILAIGMVFAKVWPTIIFAYFFYAGLL